MSHGQVVILLYIYLENKEPVWYMCLKIENCCLITFVEIRIGEKVCENA